MNLALKGRVRSWMEGPTRALVRAGITADHLTVLGCVLSVAAAGLLATGRYGWAGVALLGSGLCDMLDGAVARAGRGETRRGAFMDSALDRVGESALYVASLWRGPVFEAGAAAPRWAMLLPALALASSLLVSYARARAQGVGVECRVGLMERGERMVVQIAALFAAAFWEPAWAWALLLLFVLGAWTFAQRVAHVRGELDT